MISWEFTTNQKFWRDRPVINQIKKSIQKITSIATETTLIVWSICCTYFEFGYFGKIKTSVSFLKFMRIGKPFDWALNTSLSKILKVKESWPKAFDEIFLGYWKSIFN